MAPKTPNKSSRSALVGKGLIKASTPTPEKKSALASNSAKISPDKVVKPAAKTKRTPKKASNTIADATNKTGVNSAANDISMTGSNIANDGFINNEDTNNHLEAAYRSYAMPATGFGHESNAMVASGKTYDNTMQGFGTLPSSNTASNGTMADYNNAMAFFSGTAETDTLDASDDDDGSYNGDNDEVLLDGESGNGKVKQEDKQSNDTPTKPKPRKYVMQKAKIDYHPNGRRKGRKLVLWHRARMIEKLMLHMVFECNRLNVVLPWNEIVSRLSPGSSGQSALQMLNKLRDVMVVEGHLVPPLMGKKGHGDDQGVRGYIRDLNGPTPTTVRVVDWNEEVEDLKESLNLEGVIRGSGKYKRVPGAPKVRDPSLSIPGQRRNRLPVELREAQRLEMEEKKRKKSARQSAYSEARAKAQGITVAELMELEKSKPAKPVVTPSKSKQVDRSRSLSSSSIDPADLTSDEEYTPTSMKGKHSGRGKRYKRHIKKESVSEDSDLTDFVTSEDEVATPAPVVSLSLSPRLLAKFPEGESGVKRYVPTKDAIASTSDTPSEESGGVEYNSDHKVYNDETQVVNMDEDKYTDEDEDEEVMSVYSDETHNGEVVLNKTADAALLDGQNQVAQIGNVASLGMYAGFGNSQFNNIYSANTSFYNHTGSQYLQPALNNPSYLPQYGFNHAGYDNQGMAGFNQMSNIMTPNNHYQVPMNAAHPAHYSNMNYMGQSSPVTPFLNSRLADAHLNAPHSDPGSLKLCESFVPSSEASQSGEHIQETAATSFQDENKGVD